VIDVTVGLYAKLQTFEVQNVKPGLDRYPVASSVSPSWLVLHYGCNGVLYRFPRDSVTNLPGPFSTIPLNTLAWTPNDTQVEVSAECLDPITYNPFSTHFVGLQGKLEDVFNIPEAFFQWSESRGNSTTTNVARGDPFNGFNVMHPPQSVTALNIPQKQWFYQLNNNSPFLAMTTVPQTMFPWRNEEVLDVKTRPWKFMYAMFYSNAMKSLIAYDGDNDLYLFENGSVAFEFLGYTGHVALAFDTRTETIYHLRAPAATGGNYILVVLSSKLGRITLINQVTTNLQATNTLEIEMQFLWGPTQPI